VYRCGRGSRVRGNGGLLPRRRRLRRRRWLGWERMGTSARAERWRRGFRGWRRSGRGGLEDLSVRGCVPAVFQNVLAFSNFFSQIEFLFFGGVISQHPVAPPSVSQSAVGILPFPSGSFSRAARPSLSLRGSAPAGPWHRSHRLYGRARRWKRRFGLVVQGRR